MVRPILPPAFGPALVPLIEPLSAVDGDRFNRTNLTGVEELPLALSIV